MYFVNISSSGPQICCFIDKLGSKALLGGFVASNDRARSLASRAIVSSHGIHNGADHACPSTRSVEDVILLHHRVVIYDLRETCFNLSDHSVEVVLNCNPQSVDIKLVAEELVSKVHSYRRVIMENR